jgi:hypothetical protein
MYPCVCLRSPGDKVKVEGSTLEEYERVLEIINQASL